ncbi:MAG: DUF1893 domain-containing protein [Candidatus Bathyarchaeia archaeon]
MLDQELAEYELKSRNVNLIIVKSGEVIYQSRDLGIKGFIQAIDEFGGGLAGATVADKIVGRAIGMLCLYSKIRYVYAISMSESARELLMRWGVPHKSEVYVQRLMNRQGIDLCPFEKAIKNIDDPGQAFKVLRDMCIPASSDPIDRCHTT